MNTKTNSIAPATASEFSDVVLYEHRDFQGKSQSFFVGGARAEPIGQLTNQVSSLSVPSGVTVTLRNTQTGIGVSFTGDADYVGDQINDQADFIEIIQECVPGSDVC
jgi:hypothetical protein